MQLGAKMIYLDNAATTNYKPQCVIDAVTETITKYPFNPNRGGHKQALELERKLYGKTRTRDSILLRTQFRIAAAYAAT